MGLISQVYHVGPDVHNIHQICSKTFKIVSSQVNQMMVFRISSGQEMK